MKFFATIFITFLFLFSQAQDGINFFDGTFDEAKELAKKEGKLIFMDAYATWCGPCKRMSSSVFPLKSVGDFYNRNFINLKMDMEKGEGKTLRKTYGVSAYPTLLFLDFNGEVVYETKGARDENGLIELGKKALLPNQSAVTDLQSKWNEGNREPSFLKEYIKTQSALGEDYSEAMENYLSALSFEDKISDANNQFLFDHAEYVNAPATNFVLENKEYFESLVGQDAMNTKIIQIANNSVNNAIAKKDENILNEVVDLLKANKPEGYKEETVWLQTKYYGKTEDWSSYDKYVTTYIKKYKSNDDKALRDVAWNYYMKIDDPSKLKKAEKWTVQAIDIDNNYENNLAQAYLLYKLENYSEAQDAVEYAIILAGESQKKTQNAEILRNQIYSKLGKSLND